MIALVLEVITLSISCGLMPQLLCSTSTTTGVAFACKTALIVAAKVKSGTITSSPSPCVRIVVR